MKCSICGETKNLHRCYSCKKYFCKEHIEYDADPYASEIGGDNTKVWECFECRKESALDI
jgi:hypothetical protein